MHYEYIEFWKSNCFHNELPFLVSRVYFVKWHTKLTALGSKWRNHHAPQSLVWGPMQAIESMKLGWRRSLAIKWRIWCAGSQRNMALPSSHVFITNNQPASGRWILFLAMSGGRYKQKLLRKAQSAGHMTSWRKQLRDRCLWVKRKLNSWK